MLDEERNMINEEGQLSPEIKQQAEELMVKVATACQGYPQMVVMFVLEAALTEQIAIYSPMLGDLFSEMMAAYRKRAMLLLTVSSMLKEKLAVVTDEASLNEALKGLKSELEVLSDESTPKE